MSVKETKTAEYLQVGDAPQVPVEKITTWVGPAEEPPRPRHPRIRGLKKLRAYVRRAEGCVVVVQDELAPRFEKMVERVEQAVADLGVTRVVIPEAGRLDPQARQAGGTPPSAADELLDRIYHACNSASFAAPELRRAEDALFSVMKWIEEYKKGKPA